MSDSTFTGNSAGIDGVGGGLVNERCGTATVTRQHLHRQLRRQRGGGLDNDFGTATVRDSTFTGNSASSVGGGLANDGTATVSGSTFTGNSASLGGGLVNFGDGDGERQHLHRQLRQHRRRPRNDTAVRRR